MLSATTVAFTQNKSFPLNSKASVDKIGSIKFSKLIDGHSILDNIEVEDSNGNIVKITVESDNNIVEVNPPVEGYKSEETYILRVLNSIESTDHSKIKTSYEIRFAIKKIISKCIGGNISCLQMLLVL